MKKLEVVNIIKQINHKTILSGTSLTIEKGSIHVIEGKSGSGKSTLLSIIGGMEKPTRGTVLFGGKDIYSLSDSEQSNIRSKDFGFVFQTFHLLLEMTARQNILLPTQLNRGTEDFMSIDELAQELEITEVLDKKAMYLSGGEQQRVAIGRAIVTNPSFIFADEPTGNLDVKTSAKIMDLLLQLNKSKDMALVIVTHQQNLIEKPHIKYQMEDGHLRV